ncbi:MAG: HEAT repeat domain-containing protein [Acidobacteria bacterium]|nr:HEAT repeat domain-containing protein [Acidobacteriota bacterium]
MATPIRRRALHLCAGFTLAALHVALPPTPHPATAQEVFGQGDQVADWLLALGSPDDDRRLLAIRALGVSGDDRAVGPLVQLAQAPDEDAWIRGAAIEALGMLRHPAATGALLEWLARDFDERTGMWASLIPALAATGDRRATPLLVRALDDPRDDWLGREMAAQALGELGDPAAVGPLVAAANRADTRAAALAALVGFADSRAMPAFLGALQEGESPEGLAAAREGLVVLGQGAVDVLAATLREHSPEWPDTFRRVTVVEILAEIDTPEAQKALGHAANQDPDPAVRVAARAATARRRP